MSQTGVWGPPQGIFLEKKNYFNAIWFTLRTFLELLKITELKANWNNQICESSLYLKIKSKTRLKSWIWVLNFVSDLAQDGEAKCIASCNIFSSN